MILTSFFLLSACTWWWDSNKYNEAAHDQWWSQAQARGATRSSPVTGYRRARAIQWWEEPANRPQLIPVSLERIGGTGCTEQERSELVSRVSSLLRISGLVARSITRISDHRFAESPHLIIINELSSPIEILK